MPSLALGGGYTLQEQHPIGARNTSEWSASAQMGLPIFDRNQGNIRKAQSVQAQAAINYTAQVVQAGSDIEQALNAFNASHEILAENGATLIQSARKLATNFKKDMRWADTPLSTCWRAGRLP